MDFNLSNEQRSWQMAARKFAEEEIRPISLRCDAVPTAAETFDWDIIKKGSKLGFRTLAVPKEWGGHGTDFVTQALVMAELAKADSAISKAFSQNWKWSHLISATCTEEQKERFLKPFVADDTFLLGKGITEPSAGSDNRLPPDDIKAGLKLKAERKGDEWILNGEKAFIANAPVGKLFFIDARTDASVPLKQGTTLFLVSRDTPGFRIGKVFNKSGWRFYQNGEMIFENARVPHANVVGDVGGAVKQNRRPRRRYNRRRYFRRSRTVRQRAWYLRRCLRNRDALRQDHKAERAGVVRAAERPAPDQQDVHADRGAALVRDAGGLGARYEDPFLQRRAGDELVDRRGAGGDRALHGSARRPGLRDGPPHRQTGARFDHLEPSRRRQRAAHEGGAAAGGACRPSRHTFHRLAVASEAIVASKAPITSSICSGVPETAPCPRRRRRRLRAACAANRRARTCVLRSARRFWKRSACPRHALPPSRRCRTHGSARTSAPRARCP